MDGILTVTPEVSTYRLEPRTLFTIRILTFLTNLYNLISRVSDETLIHPFEF